MNFRHMAIVASLLSLISACAPVDPEGGGTIRFRCNSSGQPTIVRPCGAEQTPVCITNADVRSDSTTAGICCDTTENRTACIRGAFPDASVQP